MELITKNKHCLYCGRFLKKPSKTKKYCGELCATLLRSKMQEIYIIFRKDKCELCDGLNANYENLLVHHKDCNQRNNDPSNLMTLCRLCHGKEHSRIRIHFQKKI